MPNIRSGVALAALAGTTCLSPHGAAADSCTPAALATTGPVTCAADSGPDGQSFFYDNSRQIVGIDSGTFVTIGINAGDDEVLMTGGTVDRLGASRGSNTFTIDGGVTTTLVAGTEADRLTVASGAIGDVLMRRGDDVVIVNGGTINRIDAGDGADDVTIAGGDVALIQGGGGDDAIRLEAGAAGSVFAGDGADDVFLDGAATIRTQVSGEGGADVLHLVGTGVLDGSFTSFESLEISPGADWVFRQSGDSFSRGLFLNPTSSLDIAAGRTLETGDVVVAQSATLAVNGVLGFRAANVGLGLGGTLAGSGEITNTGGRFLVDAGSTAVIRPGRSIGTLTINSDVAIRSGARLVAEIDPAAAQTSDLLAVNGSVVGIDDLTVVVEASGPGATAADYVAGNDYVVLRAMSLDGDTPIVTEGGNLPALVDVAVVGSPSASGEVALAFSEVPLAQLAVQPAVTGTGNPNHASVATGLAQVAVTAPATTLVSGATLVNALQTKTNDQLAALDEVHAEPFSSYQTVALEDYDMVAGIVLGRAGAAGLSFGGLTTPTDIVTSARNVAVSRGRPAAGAMQGAWGSAAYVDGSIDGEAGLGNFGYTIGGLVLGADLYDDGTIQAGVFGAINRTALDEHDSIDQRIEGDSIHLGAYASWRDANGLTVSGVFGLAGGRHESTREVPDVGAFTGGTAEADFDTRGVYIGAEVQRELAFGRGGWSVTPSAALVYARTTQGEAVETGGGDFSFSLDEASAESLMTDVGVTVSRSFDASGQDWTFLGSAHYRHDWLADENAAHEISVDNGILGSFTQVGQNRGAHGFTAGLGLAAQVSDGVEVGAGYAYSWNENGTEQAFGASVLFSW